MVGKKTNALVSKWLNQKRNPPRPKKTCSKCQESNIVEVDKFECKITTREAYLKRLRTFKFDF